jgi:hypothetical protein
MEAEMYTNDLNSAYEYERERRSDERRAATESQRAHGLRSKPRIVLPVPAIITGIVVLLVTLLRVF